MAHCDVLAVVPNDVWREIFTFSGASMLFDISHTCQLFRRLTLQLKKTVTEDNCGTLCAYSDLNSLIDGTFTQKQLDTGLHIACLRGHYKLALFLWNKGARNANLGLKGGCSGGHVDIIELMLRKGANKYKLAFNAACTNGHVEAARMMVKCGVKYFGRGFTAACRNGHTELAIFSLNPENYSPELVELWRTGEDITFSLHQSLYDHRHECVERLHSGISVACKNKHLEIIALLKHLTRSMYQRMTIFFWCYFCNKRLYYH